MLSQLPKNLRSVRWRRSVGLVALLALVSFSSVATAVSEKASADLDVCAALSKVQLPDVVLSNPRVATAPAAHCVVDGLIGRTINFRLWLPEAWNGKFVMGGGGGFAGAIANQAMTLGALQKGYATAATDTGHQANGLDGSWALNDLEAIVNYAHVAIHRTTVVSKALVREHYGRPADANYFAGCSNGGRQALQEAQRYPNDFDAILAGAPALSFGGIGSSFTYITQRMYPDSNDLRQPALSMDDRKLLRAAIEEQCDAEDGIVDGILNDPPSCKFDPAVLACRDGATEGCLSKFDLSAVQAIYGGPIDAAGEPLYVGFPFGAEDIGSNGWGSWLVGRENGAGKGVPNAAYGFGVGMMRYFIYHDADWSYNDYDFSTYREDSAFVSAILDADNPDLDAFRSQGGKLLMYHGWSDAALSANATIDYVEAVKARSPQAMDDVQLFLMPGVLHCAGGKGPSQVDWLDALDQWHTTGKAPVQLKASFTKDRARRLCAWPTNAVFTGQDANDPESFTCQ